MNTPQALIESAYAAFGRGDLPALLALMDDAIEWQFVADRAAPYTATVRGKAQVAEWFAAVAQTDDIQRFEPRQFLAGEGHVAVRGWERCTTRATGRAFESDWVHLPQVQGGRITRFFGMLDAQAAAATRG